MIRLSLLSSLIFALLPVSALAQGQLQLEESGPGTDYVGFKAPASVPANLLWTLPSGDGSANQCLATDGSGTLSWRSAGGTGDFLASGTVPMTGTFKATNGTAALPGITFNSDQDNGLFLSGTNTLGFVTQATERVTVDANGKVGIGTTSPSQPLHVKGDQILLEGPDSTWTGMTVSSYGTTGAHTPNFVTTRARGTAASPTYALAGDIMGILSFRNHDAWVGATVRGKATENHSATVAGSKLEFLTTDNGGETESVKMMIDHDGNVGIGTTAPSQPLHVKGDQILLEGPDSTWTGMTVSSYGTTGAHTPNFVTTRARGTAASPTYALAGDIMGILSFRNHDAWVGATVRGKATENHSATVAGSKLEFLTTDNGGETESVKMMIDHDGNVGVGTTGPLDKLHVAGDIRVGTGTTGCVKDADGTVIAGTCSSDVRFKKDIEPLGSKLEQVSQLQPVTYKWRSEEFPDKHFGHQTETGLIAQQVQETLPELVTEDDEGFLRVHFTELNIYILQALKELYSTVKAAIADISILKDKDAAKDREIKFLHFDIQELRVDNQELRVDNQELRAGNEELRADNKELRNQNTAIKTYLCSKDPDAPICN